MTQSKLSSADISDLFMHLELKSAYTTTCKDLTQLFDFHTQFISYYNEWKSMYKEFKLHEEDDYINYMNHLERANPNIFNNLHLSGIAFDSTCTSVDQFIDLQNKKTGNFPFAPQEIVGWDDTNFIVNDNIYYEMTGKHMIFFLSRLDKVKQETSKKSTKQKMEKL
jgi:hypothetical protein